MNNDNGNNELTTEFVEAKIDEGLARAKEMLKGQLRHRRTHRYGQVTIDVDIGSSNESILVQVWE